MAQVFLADRTTREVKRKGGNLHYSSIQYDILGTCDRDAMLHFWKFLDQNLPYVAVVSVDLIRPNLQKLSDSIDRQVRKCSAWCRTNTSGHWALARYYLDGPVFNFSKEEDAVLFKIYFG